MQLQLITPEKILLDSEIAMVVAPGSEGDFGVLAGHAPFVSTLKEGTLTVQLKGGETKEFPVKSGIAEVNPERVIILLD